MTQIFPRFASARIAKASVSLTEDSPSIMQLGQLGHDTPKPSRLTKGSRHSCTRSQSAPLDAKRPRMLSDSLSEAKYGVDREEPLLSVLRSHVMKMGSELSGPQVGIMEAISYLLL